MVIAVDGPGFRGRNEELVQLVWTANNAGACEYTVCKKYRGQGAKNRGDGMAHNNPKPIRMSRRAKVCVASQIKVALNPLLFPSVAIYKNSIPNNEPNCYIKCHTNRDEE